MERRVSYPQVLEIRRGAVRPEGPASAKPTQQVLTELSPQGRPERARAHHARRADMGSDR
jgi:hypothetical protein